MENSSNNRRQLHNTALAVRSNGSNGLPSNGLPLNGVPHQANSTTMQPTWRGFVHTTFDALMVLEACLGGTLNHIPRRPHDRERASIITGGNVFIYEENASGIKRWTDGVTWSPSRIMGNFLVYRELKEPFPAGEKKKAKKRKRSAEENDSADQLSPQSEQDRKLVGSLVDSYGFKEDGLIKKTLNVRYNNVQHHIVSYYTLEDVKNGRYNRPEYDIHLRGCRPRQELISDNHFKAGISLEENIDPWIHEQSSQQTATHNMMSTPMAMTGMPAIQGMPGAQMAHDSPQNTHISQFGVPMQAPGHSLPPQPSFQEYPSNQYAPQPQTQPYAQHFYASPHPTVESNPNAMHGSISDFNFMPTTTTSNQSTAFGVNQMNPTALPTNNPYRYQSVPSPIDPQWFDADTNDFKAPASKRRQTTSSQSSQTMGSQATSSQTMNFPATSFEAMSFQPSIHSLPSGGNNRDFSYYYDNNGAYYNGMSPMLQEQGSARAH